MLRKTVVASDDAQFASGFPPGVPNRSRNSYSSHRDALGILAIPQFAWKSWGFQKGIPTVGIPTDSKGNDRDLRDPIGIPTKDPCSFEGFPRDAQPQKNSPLGSIARGIACPHKKRTQKACCVLRTPAGTKGIHGATWNSKGSPRISERDPYRAPGALRIPDRDLWRFQRWTP